MQTKSVSKLIVAMMVAAFAALALAGCITVQVPATSSADSSSASDESTESASSEASDDDSSDASSSASVSSSAASSAASSSTTTVSGKTQKIGNKKVGYLEVPATWEDHTSDMDPNTVEAYELVLYWDPSTEYNSTTLGHTSYSESIQLTVAPTSYKEIASGIIEGFENDTARFSGTDSMEITLNGKNAILITSYMTKDKLQLATIVVDRDGDGHAAVAITMNCGMDEKAAQRVLQCANTWTY